MLVRSSWNHWTISNLVMRFFFTLSSPAALEKVVKHKGSDHTGDGVESESESLRRRPKTINKLLEKQEQLQQQQQQQQQVSLVILAIGSDLNSINHFFFLELSIQRELGFFFRYKNMM